MRNDTDSVLGGFGLGIADMSTINIPLDCLDALVSLLLKKISIYMMIPIFIGP